VPFIVTCTPWHVAADAEPAESRKARPVRAIALAAAVIRMEEETDTVFITALAGSSQITLADSSVGNAPTRQVSRRDVQALAGLKSSDNAKAALRFLAPAKRASAERTVCPSSRLTSTSRQ
jgi:hypothetical protein